MRWSAEPANLAHFGEILRPEEAVEPILPKAIRETLLAWLTEIWAEDELAAVGLTPRRKALFTGPPGVGKTTLAHHLAARLGLPMVVVRRDRLIDRYLGSSAQNIAALFDAAEEAEPHFLFFDEVDGIAQKRQAATQGAEHEQNSWVDTLLERVERYPGFLVAASNRGEDIDPALWRRFQLRVVLDNPGPAERARILERYLAPFFIGRTALERLELACSGASPALLRELCEALKRYHVIGPAAGWPMERDRVFDQVLAGVAPHPDQVRPALWSSESREGRLALEAFPWPLREAGEPVAAAPALSIVEDDGSRRELGAGDQGAVVVRLRADQDLDDDPAGGRLA